MNVLVCQITRGLAPAPCIVWAVKAASSRHAQYAPVVGYPAVEAKNLAVALSLEASADLVLCEDDICVTEEQWGDILRREADGVLFAEALCRDGNSNTIYNADGGLRYSGSVLLRIPLAILRELSVTGPLFEPWIFSGGENPHPIIRDERGCGSDVFFWRRVLAMNPVPAIRCIGRVGHVMHELNSGKHDLQNVSQWTVLR